MHFQNSESRNVVSQHNPVGTRGLVHALYDLKIAVGEVEVILMDGNTPGVRQARHYGDAVTPIRIPTLNLWTCSFLTITKINISAYEIMYWVES